MPVNLFLPTSSGTFKLVNVSELGDIVDKVIGHPEVQDKLIQIEAGEGGSLSERYLWLCGIAPSIGSHPIVQTTLQELLNMSHIRRRVRRLMLGWVGPVISDCLVDVKNLVGSEFSDFSVKIAENFVGEPYFVFKYLDGDLFGDPA